VSPGELIIADGGFIGGSPLICPFHVNDIRSASSVEEQQSMLEFNSELTSNRIIVEDVLGWIKSRAKILGRTYHRKKESQAAVLRAACCFNNYIRTHRVQYTFM